MTSVNGDWLDDFYSSVDAMRIDEIVEHFAPDGEFVFANQPAAIGHTAIRRALNDFYSTIESIRHTARNRWSVDDRTTILKRTCGIRLARTTSWPSPVSLSSSAILRV